MRGTPSAESGIPAGWPGTLPNIALHHASQDHLPLTMAACAQTHGVRVARWARTPPHPRHGARLTLCSIHYGRTTQYSIPRTASRSRVGVRMHTWSNRPMTAAPRRSRWPPSMSDHIYREKVSCLFPRGDIALGPTWMLVPVRLHTTYVVSNMCVFVRVLVRSH